MDIMPCIGDLIYTLRVFVNCRARILTQKGDRTGTFFLRQTCQEFFRKNDFQLMILHTVPKSAPRLGMCIHIGQIGLDIVDRRSVHEINTRHHKHRAKRIVKAQFHKPHAGQPDGVGPEG